MDGEPTEIADYFKTPEFQDLLERQLEILDRVLSRWEQSVNSRPMAASMMFVEYCISDSDDKPPPPSYLEQEWFGQVVALTTRWYARRYGMALLESRENLTPAVVSLFGTTFRVSIPNFPTKPTEESGRVVMFFARQVLDHEDPLAWIDQRPDLAGHSAETADAVRCHVRTICDLTRKVDWALSFAKRALVMSEDLPSSIRGQFEKAVADICGNRRGPAIWELHLAVEMTLKLFLAQRGVVPIPRIHDLAELARVALTRGLPSAALAHLGVIPHHSDSAKHRYSELPALPLQVVMGIYEAALRTVGDVAEQLDRHAIGQRDAVWIQALPWHPSRKKKDAPSEGE